MANLFLDLEGGNNANSGADFANRFKTLSAGATAARTAPGDVVRMMASRQGDIGSKTWTNGTRTVTGSIPVKNIDLCDSNTGWTVSANVTLNANSTTRKEGTGSISITFASGFTTGKVIYKALGASTDFSAYQQVCLWIRSSSAQSANRFRVCLRSDTTGDTVVDNLTIPFAIDPTNTWHAVVIDKGSALGSAIQSIAIYADSDPATPTILIDDIIAAKAPSASDCVTLHTLISKSNTVASWTSPR